MIGWAAVVAFTVSGFARANESGAMEGMGRPVNVAHPHHQFAGWRLTKEYPEAVAPAGEDANTQFIPNLEQTRWLSALTILLLLLWWETVAPFFLQFHRNLRDRAVHAWRNLLLGILNAAIISVCFAGLWLWASEWSETHRFGLLHWLHWHGWTRAVGAVVLFDLWMYAWHRMNHRLPFLWRFHRTHHSDLKMDVTTAHRFHLGEISFPRCFGCR